MSFKDTGVWGVDISRYQDNPDTPAVVDFQRMKDNGVSFVIIRVGQGNFIDREWRKHYINSKGILPRAAYWYFDPVHDPLMQADLCLSALGQIDGRLWLDLEFYWKGDFSAPKHWRMFMERIEAAGYKTGVYTRKTWWDAYAAGADLSFFSKRPLWQAQYPKLSDIMIGFPEPMIHQSGTPVIGIDLGVESLEIDYDRWNSNYEFYNEWKTTVTETESHMIEIYVPTTYDVALRPEHNTNNTAFLYVPKGTRLTSDVPLFVAPVQLSNTAGVYQYVGDKWAYVSYPVAGVPTLGWVAIVNKGSVICTYKDLGTPPVTETPPDYVIAYWANGQTKKYIPE